MKITSGLSNGQVLQRIGSRGATTKIEGTCVESGPVVATISFSNRPMKGWKKQVVGKASDGKFSAVLKGIPAGGPYRLLLEIGKKRLEIPSFYVGDVWVLAGQSNMQGVGNMSGAAEPHSLIRAFSMRREWRLGTDPLHILPESPDVCHHGGTQCSREDAEKMRRKELKGTGVGIFFGREMLKRSKVPQGLICTAHGGTSMEQWSPGRKNLGGESLYASMVESVRATGQPVAGVLWYQGESDANPTAAPLYTERMKKLVEETRADLGQPRLPWIIVQLARFFNVGPDYPLWNNIQEQQRLLPQKIKYLETVPAIDLAMDDFIHVGAKGFIALGDRMARAADRLVCGNKKEKRPPQLRQILYRSPSARDMSPGVEVIYDDVVGELKSTGEPDGFVLINPDGSATPSFYKMTVLGNRVQLNAQAVLPKGSRLSYGHGYVPHCNITDGRGFPLPVFGPSEIEGDQAAGFLPYVTKWRVSEVVVVNKPLDKVSCPELELLHPQVKTYGEHGFAANLDGFICERPAWQLQGKSTGHAYFQATLNLDEPMKLQVLIGYDGPIRLWIDGKSFFTDMKGVNPCVPDKASKIIELKRGAHDVRVGMDLKDGATWGFFLRFRRKDVSSAKLRAGDFAKPTYSV